MQNMSESSENFLLEFVLPLLQAKKAERLENRRTNASQVRLGFNIPLEHHQQHRAVMMAHVKDKLRFFYHTQPRLSSDGFGEAEPTRKYEVEWTPVQRNQFFESFRSKFPSASVPIFHEHKREENVQAEEHEDEPIGEFAELSKYSFNKQVRFLSLKIIKILYISYMYLGIDNGKQEA
jgi:hypothetical protein